MNSNIELIQVVWKQEYLLYHPLGVYQRLLHDLLHAFLIGFRGVLLEVLGKITHLITKASFIKNLP